MQAIRKLLLAGIATAGVAALTGLAVAASAPAFHEMTVEMPDGGVAHIRYTGNVAPKVSFDQAAVPMVAFTPNYGFFAPDPMFAAINRITADMDRQMNSMLYQADQLQKAARGGPLYDATLMKGAPSGTSSYFVSTANGGNFCMKSTQITVMPSGKSKVVSHTAGNCGSSDAAAPASVTTGLAHSVSAKVLHTQSEPRERI